MNILVTGGSKALVAPSVALAAPGRTILINYLRNDKAAEETAAMVREQVEAKVVRPMSAQRRTSRSWLRP